MFICYLRKWNKNVSMQICFQMIQFPRLFINRVNWILKNGLLGKKKYFFFFTLKYSFEMTPFDSGVKDRLIDKMINRQHDKWNFNEAVSFICYHVVLIFFFFLCFLLWCVFVQTIDSSWNLVFLCCWTRSPGCIGLSLLTTLLSPLLMIRLTLF